MDNEKYIRVDTFGSKLGATIRPNRMVKIVQYWKAVGWSTQIGSWPGKRVYTVPFCGYYNKAQFFEHGRERVKGLITETVPFHHRAEAFGFVCLPIFDSYGHANNWLLSPPKRYHDPFCDPWWFFIVQPGGTSNSLKATTTSQLMLDTTEIILNHETWPPSFWWIPS